MKSSVLKAIFSAAVVFSASSALPVFADVSVKTVALDVQNESSPHKVIEKVTVALMDAVKGGKQALEKDPQAYFNKVRGIMETVVDFDYIAKNVMGAKYWNAATDEQKKKFVGVFTDGLVQTYAKGMANFADLDISVVPPEGDISGKNRVAVLQRVKGPEGVNNVAYTMGKHKSGQWKLINVVLDGVNLGETLRSQFAQSVNENKGDLDATIAGWQLKT